MLEYRFLTDVDFDVIYHTFVEAFSDYFVPLNLLTKEQLGEMMTRRGADLNLSAGAFDGNRLVGFNLNALDDFCGRRTVYDVATGVISSYRRKGIAKSIFEFSLPSLRATNAEQYILEAIELNEAALTTYRKVGFEISRKFKAFRRESTSIPQLALNPAIEIQQITIDWNVVQKFWNWLPSWQNSIRSIERSRFEKISLGAFINRKLVGYAICYLSNGDIPQFAVEPSVRRKGVGSALLNAAQRLLPTTTAARVINIESTDQCTTDFLRTVGFENLMDQYEMKLNLRLSQ